MKMVVGLGNPGRKYAGTRHNVGFEVITELARRYDVGRPKSKFNGEFAETIIQNEKTILVCPLTFMNLSGQTVRAAVDFFKLELPDLLIICDDFNLALGRIRIKPNGSAGGQNGLDDIIQRLGTREFSRLRLGIGTPPPNWDVSNYVLGKFAAEDRETIDQAIVRSADATEAWIADGISSAMNRFNADPEKAKNTKDKNSDKNQNEKPKDRQTEENETKGNQASG